MAYDAMEASRQGQRPAGHGRSQGAPGSPEAAHVPYFSVCPLGPDPAAQWPPSGEHVHSVYPHTVPARNHCCPKAMLPCECGCTWARLCEGLFVHSGCRRSSCVLAAAACACSMKAAAAQLHVSWRTQCNHRLHFPLWTVRSAPQKLP